MRVGGLAWVLAVTFVAGGGVYLLVARRGRADERRMRADLAAAVERGTLADLGRAQAIGRRLILADGQDRQTAAALAFADALLAVDYGAETAEEARRALAGAHLGETDPADDGTEDAPRAMAGAAWALARLRGGDPAGAVRAAAAAVARDPELPQPLYALARARARAGDLAGAERALDAAIVEAPSFAPGRLAWAELRLDLGDPQSAATGLAPVLARAPADPRALLLLDQVQAALGQPPPALLDETCRAGRRGPPLIVAGCALSRAGRARRAGSRADARAQAEEAARQAPDEPRLLAGAALLLAQLGAIDLAAGLVARARHLAAPETSPLAWAQAAVALGRGRAPAPHEGPRPTDAEARLLIARLALAGGGVAALESALGALGPAAVVQDADLRTLSGLTARGGHETAAPPGDDPLRAYVNGLRANLAGDPGRAAERLAGALAGHGDACRAAGEYIGALRALKLRPRPELFAQLRGENAGCVNLPRRGVEVLPRHLR